MRRSSVPGWRRRGRPSKRSAPRDGGLLTWKKKLPQPERRQYSVKEIAEKSGRSVQEVMNALQDIGEFVDSPRKAALEEPVRRRVYETLGVPYTAPSIHKVTLWETRGSSSGAPSTKPASPVTGSHGGRRRPRPRADHPTPLNHSDDLASISMIDASWELYRFTLAERDAWQVYLSDRQAKDAHRLREAGFRPDDLGIEVSGWSVLKRVRAGEDPKAVKRLLEQHRAAS